VGATADMLAIASVLADRGLDDSWRDRTLAEARDLITKYWPFVELIADKLLEKRDVEHSEIFTILNPLIGLWKDARTRRPVGGGLLDLMPYRDKKAGTSQRAPST
jgi:hypothetical protein